MRLTLRTLLAYLDGNLEPNDAEDIGKKIEESEFATKLVHLIRDCTRRLRLGAPPLMGRGLAADSNSVAEYLEYRLADERVPEFEKICLESEIHLAEVASCHQILTLVLGEPAEIDSPARDRLYALAGQVDAPPIEPASAPPKTPAPAAIPPAPPVMRRPKPEVPEYLRESRWRWWPVAALVLIAATLTFGGLLLFGPPQLRERLLGMAQTPAEDADAGAQPGTDPSPPPDTAEPATDEMPTEAESQSSQPEAASDQPADPERAITTPETSPPEESDSPPAPQPPEPTPLEPGNLEASEADDPGLSLPNEPPQPDAPGSDQPEPAAPRETPAEAENPPPAAARQQPEGFGRYHSDSQILLRQDPDTGDWVRLPARAPLNSGDRLLSLPSFQPLITLSSNINVQADGSALFELVGWTDEGIPILAVEFGRLLMLTVGKPDNSLLLKLNGHKPMLTFVDAEATLAIDVSRELPAGQDPESAQLPLRANVYATSGLIRVQEGDGDTVELQSPAQSPLAPAIEEQPGDPKFPDWVTSDEQSDFDRLATAPVAGYLENGKSAGLQLRELTDPRHRLGRRREIRGLAIRSLAYLGQFEPCVKALNEENERLFWPAARNELRAAIARGPETAAQVRLAFENQRGVQAGAELYRILWGYSTAELQDGADRELVEGLNSDALDVRVMCFLTLQDLTGATHGYRPDDQQVKRRTAYNVWKQRIGRIAPRRGRPSSKARSPKGR